MRNFPVKNKKGLTLIETLVAVFLFAIGIIGFTMLFQRSWNVNSFVVEEGTATATASTALDTMTKDLRKVRQADNGNYAIAAVGSNSLTVYLDIDNDNITEQVSYFLQNGQLDECVSKPTGTPPAVTYPSTASPCNSPGDKLVVLANYVTNTVAQPVFLYYDNNYPADTFLVNPQTSQVSLIQVQLWINIKPLTAPQNINLHSFVQLRNLNDNN